MPTTSAHLERLTKTGQIDGLIGAKKVGNLIDFYNQSVDQKKKKQFENDITDRNKYFWKLWLMAIEARDRGEITKPRSKPKIII